MEAKIVLDDSILAIARKMMASKGGQSKSPKKMAALARNRKKAWAARRKKAA